MFIVNILTLDHSEQPLVSVRSCDVHIHITIVTRHQCGLEALLKHALREQQRYNVEADVRVDLGKPRQKLASHPASQ